jgi:hypothetical protein
MTSNIWVKKGVAFEVDFEQKILGFIQLGTTNMYWDFDCNDYLSCFSLGYHSSGAYVDLIR